jgi:hypothetical protein
MESSLKPFTFATTRSSPASHLLILWYTLVHFFRPLLSSHAFLSLVAGISLSTSLFSFFFLGFWVAHGPL